MSTNSTFEILASGQFRQGQLAIDHRPKARMPFDKDIDAAIEREWRARRRDAKRQGYPLFSGRLFRIVEYAVRQSNGRPQLHLVFGDTTYREYVGTRVPSFSQHRDRSELANPLAVCATIVTADDLVVIARRQGVDVASGQYHVPGGYIDRGKDADPFTAMAREIHEEVGLVVEPASIICLGLVYDLLHPHYELCFTVRVPVTFAEVTRLHPAEPEASCLDPLANSHRSLRQFLTDHHSKMSPTGEACLTLYEGSF